MRNAWILKYMLTVFYTCPLEALQYSSDKKSYEQAEHDCHLKGTRLVRIDTDSKYEMVKNFMLQRNAVEDVWTDLRSEGQEYYIYRHSDGTVATFFKWDASIQEPNAQDTDRCIRLHAQTLMYRTWICDREYHYICESSDVSTTATHETLKPWSVDDFTTQFDENGLESQDTSSPGISSGKLGKTALENRDSERQDSSSTAMTSGKSGTFTQDGKDSERQFDSTTSSHEMLIPWTGTSRTSTLVSPSSENITDECEVCGCNIFFGSLNDPAVLEAMKERIQDIKLTLYLNKSDLSKQVRRKISASDERMSSTLLGCVGVVFLVFTIGVFAIPDTIKLMNYVKGKI